MNYHAYAKLRRKTHTHIIGPTGRGKSKLIEHMMRQDLFADKGFCAIAWHSTLYRDVLAYLAYVQPDREIVLINPSEPSFVVGFNPFVGHGNGDDISTLVSRRVEATIKPWGLENTNELPTFERVCRALYHFAVVSGETLPNVSLLLRYPKKELREYAIEIIEESYAKEQWRELHHVKSLREWREQTLSTNNRLARFVGSAAVRRFMGLKSGNVDIGEAMERGAIVLVNLGASAWLDRDAARVFASLLLNEFFEASMRRVGTDKLYTLYCDEFQEYGGQLAPMLEQVRKGGLHLVLAHQHFAQLDEEMKHSILTNARLRFVFGGLPFPTALELAKELYLPEINERQIKETYYHTVTKHELEWMKVEGVTSGMTDGESAMGEQDGWSQSQHESSHVSEVPMLMPYYEEEVTHDAEWSFEEKAAHKAERLMALPERTCVEKLDLEDAEEVEVPEVRLFALEDETVGEYAVSLYERVGGRPGAEVERLVAEDEREFVRKATKHLKAQRDEDFSSRPRRRGGLTSDAHAVS